MQRRHRLFNVDSEPRDSKSRVDERNGVHCLGLTTSMKAIPDSVTRSLLSDFLLFFLEINMKWARDSHSTTDTITLNYLSGFEDVQ